VRTSINESAEPLAAKVSVDAESLNVELVDGRTIGVPLAWYPRLFYGSPKERARWELIADGFGIHWPALDEDISVDGLLAGRRSGETPASLAKWMAKRQKKKPRRASKKTSLSR
jgi:hypothetical protein